MGDPPSPPPPSPNRPPTSSRGLTTPNMSSATREVRRPARPRADPPALGRYDPLPPAAGEPSATGGSQSPQRYRPRRAGLARAPVLSSSKPQHTDLTAVSSAAASSSSSFFFFSSRCQSPVLKRQLGVCHRLVTVEGWGGGEGWAGGGGIGVGGCYEICLPNLCMK